MKFGMLSLLAGVLVAFWQASGVSLTDAEAAQSRVVRFSQVESRPESAREPVLTSDSVTISTISR